MHALGGYQRDRGALDRRQVIHIVIEWLELSRTSVAQHVIQPTFGFAGKQRDTHRARSVEIAIDAIKHAQHAGHVEAADADLKALIAQRTRNIERTRKLVGLHADQHHHAVARGTDHGGETAGADSRVGLVERMDLEFDVGAEHAAFGAILGDAIQRSQRIRRDRRAQPLDDVTVIIVVGRLHKQQAKSRARRRGHW